MRSKEVFPIHGRGRGEISQGGRGGEGNWRRGSTRVINPPAWPDEVSHHMADAYGPPCSPGTRSPRSFASRRSPPPLPSSPPPLHPSSPRFFVRACARARVWTLLLLGRGGRDYGLAFKAACCESETGQRDEWRVATVVNTGGGRNREREEMCAGGGNIREIRGCQSPRILYYIRFSSFSSNYLSNSSSFVVLLDSGFFFLESYLLSKLHVYFFF